MYDSDTKEQFLQLRAKGWSLASIAKRLKVAQRTLFERNRQERDQIRTPGKETKLHPFCLIFCVTARTSRRQSTPQGAAVCGS